MELPRVTRGVAVVAHAVVLFQVLWDSGTVAFDISLGRALLELLGVVVVGVADAIEALLEPCVVHAAMVFVVLLNVLPAVVPGAVVVHMAVLFHARSNGDAVAFGFSLGGMLLSLLTVLVVGTADAFDTLLVS